MDNNFSAQVKEIISFSREEALRLGNDFIGTEHLLLGLIREGDNTAVRILKSFFVFFETRGWSRDIGTVNRCVTESRPRSSEPWQTGKGRPWISAAANCGFQKRRCCPFAVQANPLTRYQTTLTLPAT